MTQHPEEGTLHAYIDGELSPAETAALELHISGCARCATALAEARGFVAAASRVITTLDAAPSSAAKPVAAVAGVPAAPSRRVVRPPIFRVPYARAAALLLLVGGTAVVVDRTGAFTRGESSRAEPLMTDAATVSDVAPTVAAETAAVRAPIGAPEAAVAADLSTGAGAVIPGNAAREAVLQRGVAGGTATDGARRMRSAERAAPVSEPAPAALEQPIAATDVAAKAPAPMAVPPPPPIAMMRLEEVVVTSAPAFGPTVSRYRTKEGAIVTLTEEPLRTSFAEESAATRQRASPRVQQSAAASMAAQPINSYRWSSAERGRIYTLSGPLTVAELEAAARQLAELERVN